MPPTKDKELIEEVFMDTLNMFCIDRYGKNWRNVVGLYVVKESFTKLGQRKYIEYAIKQTLSLKNKQVEDFKAIDKKQDLEILNQAEEITKLKSQLQKKDNIIKGMNQIIQKKTLTKEQVFGKDKLQTQRDDMFKEIDKLVQFPKTRKEGIKRNKEFNNLYKKLFSEFDLESHPVYSYDEVRFRRAIVFGYKKALDKIREHLSQKHKGDD